MTSSSILKTVVRNSVIISSTVPFPGIHCWDMAAGALIVSEAGGVVLDPSGGEFDLMAR